MKTIGSWIIVALVVFGISLFTNKKEEPKQSTVKPKTEVVLPEPELESPEVAIDSTVTMEQMKFDTVVENVKKNVNYLKRKIKNIDTLAIKKKDSILKAKKKRIPIFNN